MKAGAGPAVGRIGTSEVTAETTGWRMGAADVTPTIREGMIGRPAVTLEISVGTTGAADVRSETMEGTIGTTAETTGRSVTTETIDERIGAREETGGMMEVTPGTEMGRDGTPGVTEGIATVGTTVGTEIREVKPGSETGRVVGMAGVTDGIATVGTTVGTTDGRAAPPERPRAARIWARLPAPRMLIGMVTVFPLRMETQLKFRRF